MIWAQLLLWSCGDIVPELKLVLHESTIFHQDETGMRSTAEQRAKHA
jgi:hypothetical protein